MTGTVSARTAQQIVDTVKDVCGYDINFIRPDGIIIASTNPDRIGTYHEIGHRAAEARKMLEVDEKQSFDGTKSGVNLPFSYRGEITAVIGITGNPDEVRKFAYLAQRITRLILREQDLDRQAHTQKEQVAYIVRSLINGNSISHDFLSDFMDKHGFDMQESCRTVVVQMEHGSSPENLSMLEEKIFRVFAQTGSPLYISDYPNRYILIEPDQMFRQRAFQIEKLVSDSSGILRAGAGGAHQLLHQNRSCQEALTAVHAAEAGTCANYDDLKLEILLGSLTEDSRKRFREKIMQNLNEREKDILKAYFHNECHLKQTAEQLFIHINTLQYQLDKIAKKTGLNPRKFEDAVVLYLAGRME